MTIVDGAKWDPELRRLPRSRTFGQRVNLNLESRDILRLRVRRLRRRMYTRRSPPTTGGASRFHRAEASFRGVRSRKAPGDIKLRSRVAVSFDYDQIKQIKPAPCLTSKPPSFFLSFFLPADEFTLPLKGQITEKTLLSFFFPPPFLFLFKCPRLELLLTDKL